MESKIKNEEIKSNLKSIKSFYNLEQIFSFLNMKRKLNIIIYNKHIKKNLISILKIMEE